MIVLKGYGSSYIVTQGYGWAEAQAAIAYPTPIKQPKQKAHGWNRRRLLQWGGKYKPR